MRIKIALAMASWLVAGVVLAQTPKTLAELAVYNGPDREQLLVDGAKKEGTITLYTSIAQNDLPPITAAFEKKYGFKINVWRAGSDKVLQRTLAETSAGRYEVDAIHVGSPELDALHFEKILQAVDSPTFKTLIPNAVHAHHAWVATHSTGFVQAYNTNLIKKQDLPKSWQDLTDPKWKGKLGIELTDDEWFYGLMQEMGEEKGLKLFRQIVATNGVSVRKGHSLLTNMVVSGEVPMGLTVYNYMAAAAKRKGAPVDWIALPPVIGRANGVAIARHAPHPYAALLFYEFMLSDQVQQLLASRDYIPVSRHVESPLKGLDVKLPTKAMTPEEMEKWTKLYRDVIGVTSH